MLDIPIYKAEAEIDGLADKIKASRAISYVALLQPARSQQYNTIMDSLVQANIASSLGVSSIKDLYPTESILASTVCNLNDDVFPKWDTFQARSTPINKPDNLEHNEEHIVGHMVRTWLIDSDNNLIDEASINTVEDLPDLFHVCNASVIYTHWTKDELKKRVATLIEEIEAGKKYVSMECLFTTFDYALFDDKDQLTVVARDATTAFLTKHLKVYGGSGVYDNKRVCRYLRNFVFSGKGYVDAPANPDSIIFSKGRVKVVDFTTAKYSLEDNTGVYVNNKQPVAAYSQRNNEETDNMSSELELLKSELSELKLALKEQVSANEALEKQIADANIVQYTTQIEKLQSTLNTMQKEYDGAKEKIEQLNSEVDNFKTEVKKLTDANATLVQEIAEAEEQKVRTNRVASLVDGGIDKIEAEKKVDVFNNLTDEQFQVLAAELIKAVVNTNTQQETQVESTETLSQEATEVDENEVNATQTNLENVETNDAETVGAAAADTEVDEMVKVRQSLATYISTRLGKKVPSSDDETNE